jgi:hypothetical protein
MSVSYLPYPSADQPATNVVAVTKHNSTADPSGPFRGFIIDGTSGAIKFTTVGGSDVTLSNCTVGTVYPFAISRVWDTGTVATNIYGLK